VSTFFEAADHVRAHAPKSDHSELHDAAPWSEFSILGGLREDGDCANPGIAMTVLKLSPPSENVERSPSTIIDPQPSILMSKDPARNNFPIRGRMPEPACHIANRASPVWLSTWLAFSRRASEVWHPAPYPAISGSYSDLVPEDPARNNFPIRGLIPEPACRVANRASPVWLSTWLAFSRRASRSLASSAISGHIRCYSGLVPKRNIVFQRNPVPRRK
jgi:hypothetical protein